jgi:DNA invertase Pin-like site-specific DNA recombinase
MKYIGVTYQRKSTDRDDIQQNSLDVQIDHNMETKRRHSVEILKDIIESVSAKDSGKRAGFNEMVQMAKEGKINCIIVDEPTRLSRNTVDTAVIVDLMEKGKIHTIFSY